MILTSLTLQNFRSYTKRTFTFSPTVTLIVGPNASGKTNILEAITLVSTGKSFRADLDREVITWNHDIGRITAAVGETKAEILITSGSIEGQKAPTKKYFVNGISRRLVDFLGNIRTVLFWPEHLELVTDSPSMRRRYLDSVLVQIDREYRRTLASYERGLRQRNKLLDLINEGNAGRHQLLFWDQLLIRAGGYITDRRSAYIEWINQYHLPDIRYHIVNDKSVISESRLDQYKDEEISAKATLVGPHRDDIVFQMTKKNSQEFVDVSKYGSRGEQRLAILWLKLAELSYVHEKAGDRPILLLDDIFSEFDEEHRELVLDLVGKQQTIITSAEYTAEGFFKTSHSAQIIHLGPKT